MSDKNKNSLQGFWETHEGWGISTEKFTHDSDIGFKVTITNPANQIIVTAHYVASMTSLTNIEDAAIARAINMLPPAKSGHDVST